MRYFPPETRVWTSVTFTKCLYAMAVQHNFQPDRRTGWTLPAIGHPKRSASELGLKVVNYFGFFFFLISFQTMNNEILFLVSSRLRRLSDSNYWLI